MWIAIDKFELENSTY